ncbi:MAG: hypothetical protein ACREK8_06390, partial [Gemmatimonadales bacterium]
TGLYTEPGLVHRVTELISESRRIGRAVACVGWVLNGESGPARTYEAAVAVRSSGRTSDIAGILGSGAFAIVAAGIGPTGAARLGSRLGDLLAQAAGATANEVRTTIVAGDDSSELPPDGRQLVRQLELAVAA